jgi:LytS/YehU family sensor histidine kinase
VLFSLSLLVISSLIALANISSLIDTPQVLLEVGLVSFLLNSFNALVAFILHSFISWFTDLKKKDELRQKTETLELEMLKLKLDPHFLFNTINNIDILIETDPKKASEYIVKLSSVLRFYLYKTSDSMIQLSDEIRYIQEYVDLQKIRTTNQNFINLTIEGASEAKKIFPMVFIPFIENAFKHSQNKKTDAINIQISIFDNEVHFKCHNKLKRTEIGTKGIGNLLIEKRLKLIYGDTYELNVKTSKVDYAIELKIPV